MYICVNRDAFTIYKVENEENLLYFGDLWILQF